MPLGGARVALQPWAVGAAVSLPLLPLSLAVAVALPSRGVGLDHLQPSATAWNPNVPKMGSNQPTSKR